MSPALRISSMLAGYATPEGTERFAAEAHKRGVAKLHFREFSGLVFSSIGVGTYLGEPDAATDRLVEEAIIKSVRSGACNVVDTAINYRFQRAERSVGRAIRLLVDINEVGREQVFISTKNGYLTHDAELGMSFPEYVEKHLIMSGVCAPSDIVGGIHCMKPAFLEDQLNRSLQNLGLETIDLLYLHNAAESQLPYLGHDHFYEELREVFTLYEEMRKRGRIRFYGLATWSCFRAVPGARDYLSLERVVEIARDVGGENHGFRFVQLPFNPAMPEAAVLPNQKIGEELLTFFEAAKRLGIGVFTSAPLLEGELLRYAIELGIPLRSRAQQLLQLARSAPTIAALVGHKTPKHVEENLELARIEPLSSEEFRAILERLA